MFVSSPNFTSVICDPTPLPAPSSSVDDDVLFASDPFVNAPCHIDYGYNVRLGENVYINFNCTILDTCLVTIGARSKAGPPLLTS